MKTTILMTFIACFFALAGSSFGVVGNCTIFVSPAGGGNGLSAGSPTTLSAGSSASVPGSVVCLKGGTYNLPTSFSPAHSGTAGNYITYIAYGDSPANLVWTGGSVSGGWLVNMDSGGGYWKGFSYLKFINLHLDGQQVARAGFGARYSHHLVFQGNFIENTTGSGIGMNQTDYITSNHNMIYHNGEGSTIASSATSGISYNVNCFFDTYTGFHQIIANNIVAADEDTLANTDGNGIIMDTNCSGTQGVVANNNPPALVVNNVVYMNSGQCIANYTVANIWTVNNSCYKNSLNTDSGFISYHAAEFGDNASELDYYVNNIAYAWKATTPPAFSSHRAIQATYFKNMYIGGLDFTPNAPAQFFHTDPRYGGPPVLDPTADFQWRTAPDPATIGNAFTLQAGSPALKAGIDPSTIGGIPANIVTGLQTWTRTDINGRVRSAGIWDLGAYQQSTSSGPAPPTNLTGVVH